MKRQSITQNISAIQSDMTPVLEKWVTELTGFASDYAENHRGSPQVILKDLGVQLQRKLQEKMLQPELLDTLLPEQQTFNMDQDLRMTVAYLARKLSPDMIIPALQPLKSVPVSGWITGGITGALAGTIIPAMLALKPETRILLMTGSAPIAVAAGLFATHWLSTNSMAFMKLMRFRRRERLDMEQLRINSSDAMKLWLRSQLTILLLLMFMLIGNNDSYSDDTEELPSGLVAALAKLAQVPKEKRMLVADEVIQEFYNAGFEELHPDNQLLWKENMAEHYEVIGLIQPQDLCRILEYPVIHGNKVKRKGKVTRKRS